LEGIKITKEELKQATSNLKYLLNKSERENFVISDEYLSWLEKFVMKHRGFNNYGMIFVENNSIISDYDVKMMKKLEFLYEIIMQYARNNNISPNCNAFYNSFNIKNNDVNYIINEVQEQALVYSIEIPYFEVEGAIDLKSISDNAILERK